MPIIQRWYIPLDSLTVTNGTWFGSDTGSPFPNNEVGNAQSDNDGAGFIPASFTWDGTGKETLKINDDDATFNDDDDTNQTLSEDIAGFSAGTLVETQYGYILSGDDGSVATIYVVNFAGDTGSDQVYGLVSNTPLTPGVTYTITDVFAVANAPYSSVACFCAGTLIDTADGPKPIERLQIGEMIVTKDNGPQPVRWIGSTELPASALQKNPNLRPIIIRQGALGINMPKTNLAVSPQHRILVKSRIAERMFGKPEVLVAAKQLCAVDGIDPATDCDNVTYFHMMFDQHEIVTSNGAMTESLFAGPQAINALPAAAMCEIYSLFPDLKDLKDLPPSARDLVPGRVGRELAERHVRNHKPLHA